MTIGDVLSLLRQDFPDITVSKIRFLETAGLVEPQRAPSGYRRFSPDDVERLRYVLTAQRNHYLPLKVIREHLDAIDRGLEPPEPLSRPGAPRAVRDTDAGQVTLDSGPRLRMTREELLAESKADPRLLAALESYGLIRPSREHYDGDALTVLSLAAELGSFGLEPRHLRAFRMAADREVGLVEQVVTPILRQRGGEGRSRAEDTAQGIAGVSMKLHAALVRAGIKDLLDS